MKRSIPFFNPLSVPSSPNAIRSYPAEEILDRRGETSIWFKMQPCPCPAESRLPDCGIKGCIDGNIRTYQKTYPIYGESVAKIVENRLMTRFAPITSVQSASIAGNDFGTQRPSKLNYTGFGENYIELSEHLPYWKSVVVDYEVSMFREEMFTLEATGSHRVYLDKSVKDYIVETEKVCAQLKPGGSDWEPLEVEGNDFNSVVFSKPIFGQIRIVLKLYSPINIGYRTYNIDSGNNGTKVFFENGDIELIVGTGYKMGRGDIVTMTTSMTRTSQFIDFYAGNIDRLPYSPIAKIHEVYGKVDGKLVEYFENKDFIVLDDYRIKWLTNKPQGGFSIMYEYYPSFRIVGSGENGSPENRKRPLLFKAKSISGWRARS